MTEAVALGIDIGTSAVKVAAVTPRGHVLAGIRLPLRRQSPDAWWSATGKATRQLLATGEVAPSRIRAIGMSGRGGGTVLLDRRGRLLAPPGLGQAQAEDPRVDALIGDSRRLRPLASHVLRALDAGSDIAPRLAHVLAVKDAVLLRLTGEAVSDPASGPDLLAWPLTALEQVGFPTTVLPAIRLPWERAGVLLPAAAAELGLAAALPVATGAHDGVAAQIGSGMIRDGCAALTLGTHAVLRVVVSSAAAQIRFRFYSLWGEQDSRAAYGGNARMGGASTAWLGTIAGGGTGDGERLLPALEAAAARVPRGSDGVLFLPFLGGMYYPESRHEARGAFLGLQSQHGRGHLYRAVLEGVAFAIRQIHDALGAEGIHASSINLTGGGAASLLWRQLLADVLDRPLGVSAAPGFEECVGAARCAWVYAGEFPDIDTAVANGVSVEEYVEPAARWPHSALVSAYRRYIEAADALWRLQIATRG
jgi:xylulokinase